MPQLKCRADSSAQLRFMHSVEISQFIRSSKMLTTIAIILLILWVLGLVSAYTIGGFIHILLVIAVVIILIRVIQGKRL